MKLAMVGVSHQTAAVEIREQVSLPVGEIPDRLGRLVSRDDVAEAFLLATCNRSELYVASEDGRQPLSLEGVFAEVHGCPAEVLSDCLYRHEDAAVIRHIFRVAAGVESMVFGEAEIMGQIRQAVEAARQAGSAGRVLSRLAECALAVGKKVRTETAVGQGGMSVASVAADLARQIFDDLSRARILVLGAGETGELVTRRMMDHGARHIVVSSRTYDRAHDLAERLGARAAGFDDFPQELLTADIVIASTSAPHHLIRPEHLRRAAGGARQRPVFLIDLAVPRDIDPAVQALDDVYLYDIDDLQAVVRQTEVRRRGELDKIEPIIEREAEGFLLWANSLDIVPMMLAIRDRAEAVREEEFNRLLEALPELTTRQQKALHRATKQMVRRILHTPLERIREIACTPDGVHHLKLVQRLFGVGDSTPEPDGSSEEESPERG
jgi:glutamyl-tRNA reductase